MTRADGLHLPSPAPATTRPRRAIAMVQAGLVAAMLGGCAPDAWRPDPEYNAFLTKVQNECPYFHMGTDTSRDTFNDSVFLDRTSMLYHGKITEADWRTSMYTEFDTGPDDPGIACLLSKLPGKPVPSYGAPVGIKPVETPPTPGEPSIKLPTIRY